MPSEADELESLLRSHPECEPWLGKLIAELRAARQTIALLTERAESWHKQWQAGQVQALSLQERLREANASIEALRARIAEGEEDFRLNPTEDE